MSVPGPRLYVGHVMHARLAVRANRFRYRVFSVLLDIDRLEEDTGGLWLLGYNRAGVLCFRDSDHGARDGSPLRPWVDAELERAGLQRAAQVRLLAFPRVLGYAFNPLSVYFCYDEAGALFATVYEVKNTFGDQIAYTLKVSEDPDGAVRQLQGKEMYVSPFIEMDQTYRFTLRAPCERLALRIRQAGQGGETLIATQTGRARPLTDAALVRALLSDPLMSFKVIAAIHWQALRLFLKGVPFLRAERLDASENSA